MLVNVQNLKGLDLKNNKIAKVPQWFSKLEYLRFLNLSGNGLTEFPVSHIVNMRYLSDLDLSNNKIYSLFEKISGPEKTLIQVNLVGLRQINISRN